jgi:hypothetical protein
MSYQFYAKEIGFPHTISNLNLKYLFVLTTKRNTYEMEAACATQTR